MLRNFKPKRKNIKLNGQNKLMILLKRISMTCMYKTLSAGAALHKNHKILMKFCVESDFCPNFM